MGLLLADLFVRIQADSVPLEAGLNRARQRITGLSAAAGALGALSFGTVVAAVGAIGYGLYRGIQGAGDLNESVNKAGEVFGKSAEDVIGATQKMADAYGVPKKTFLDAASSIGLIGQAANMTQKQSADLGVEIARLATDATSFNDVPLDVALQKIQAGLVGEAEPLRAFGVMLSETAVKQEALRTGLAEGSGEMTEQQKIMARLSLIRKGMARASGDLARTKDSPKNRQREIAGRAENALNDIGGAVMPVWQAFVNGAGEGLKEVSAFISRNREVIQEWAKGIVPDVQAVISAFRDEIAAFQEMAASENGQAVLHAIGSTFQWLRDTIKSTVKTIGVIYRNWRELSAIAGLKVYQAFLDIPAMFQWLGESASAFGEYLGTNWVSLLEDSLSVAIRVLENFRKSILEQFEEIQQIVADPTKLLTADYSKFSPAVHLKKLFDFSGLEVKTPKFVLPKFRPDHSATDPEMAEMRKRIATHEASSGKESVPKGKGSRAESQAGQPAAAKDEGEGDRPQKRTKDVSAAHEDLVGFAKRLQEGIFGKGDSEKSARDTAMNTARAARSLETRLPDAVKRAEVGSASEAKMVGLLGSISSQIKEQTDVLTKASRKPERGIVVGPA